MAGKRWQGEGRDRDAGLGIIKGIFSAHFLLVFIQIQQKTFVCLFSFMIFFC